MDKSGLCSGLAEEIESLEAILSPEDDELSLSKVDGNQDEVVVTVKISPLTASDTSRQYVGFYLKAIVSKSRYPDLEGPKEVDVYQVRGLDEQKVIVLLQALKERCDEYVGSPVIFTLIDDCREFLTNHNYPTCPCSICLFHIVQGDSFVKTACFHYFHSTCFGRYLKFYEPEEYEHDDLSRGHHTSVKPDDNLIPCPICRFDLRKDLWNKDVLLRERESVLQLEEPKGSFVRSKSLESLQKKMQDLFECQKQRGAIISSSLIR